MSGGTAYIYELRHDLVNRDALATGELELLPLGRADREIVRDLLERHISETDSSLAAKMLQNFDEAVTKFVKVLPRDYAAVLEARQNAVDEGLDPDGDVVWGRILEVTGG
jgi:glutamate synthase (NADPH/NADH) large chain